MKVGEITAREELYKLTELKRERQIERRKEEKEHAEEIAEERRTEKEENRAERIQVIKDRIYHDQYYVNSEDVAESFLKGMLIGVA